MNSKNGLKRMTMTKTSEMTLTQLKDHFVKKCKVINLTEYTIFGYEYGFQKFMKFLGNQDVKASEISSDVIQDYTCWLKETGIKPITVNTYLRNLSPILHHGMELNIIPKFMIRSIRTEECVKEVYTDSELMILLKKPVTDSFAEYRNWVIINFLIATGVRALELRCLKVENIDLENEMILLKKTKSKKQRYIPISKSLSKIIGEYILFRKPSSSEEFLFCNEFGQQMPRTTLQNGIKKYCLKRGVTKFSLHLFRHTFAKRWILNKGDIFTLKKILGHSSLKMVNHYLNLYGDDLKKNFDEFCPLESIRVERERIKINR
ncbi:tyrosine-type recombinase/integrase [Heliobacterium undosum]|uniref:Tyrosine-type recombinase/integrase n=1 Tax=Heliomicrobium undosum TaxID=121734 RepID=A0A845L8D9_9FIRM|nr:site-specific integrase [Heliomicrobium undosum]MZP30890.1 tyrosine-type recombinase/integrase [Heliomicrobium undosum]